MAENPVLVECPKDTWQKIATSVTVGTIKRTESEKSKYPTAYLYTYRITGDTTAISDNEAVVMFENNDIFVLDYDLPVDIHVKAVNAIGELRLNIHGFLTSSYLMDSNAEPFGLLQEDGCITSREYNQAVAEGDVPNHISWVKNGFIPASTANQTLVWNAATEYIPPATAQQMELYSTSDQDKPGGTGIQSIKIYYLDGDYNQKTTIEELNGTTPRLTTATDIFRINYTVAETIGTNLKAVGVISIRNQADTPIYDQIAVGETMSETIFYTVPAGYELYVHTLAFSSAASATGKRSLFKTRGTWDRLKTSQTIGRFFLPYSETSLIDTAVEVNLKNPSRFPEKTDLKITVGGEAGAVCSATARGWLELVSS